MNEKNITVGIVAHVDSGKTTLSEAMLYHKGNIRKLGRVDHKDAFLDNFELERQRGITIFSKQAVLKENKTTIYLIDTPGHMDFSTEMERALKVLDYAVLVINGSSRLQSHTFTLWKMLEEYKIPTFVFVNKMDMSSYKNEDIIDELNNRLTDGFIDFTNDSDLFENIAMTDEHLMDKFLMGDNPNIDDISGCIKGRKIFPCFFGSALKLLGIEELLKAIDMYTLSPDKNESAIGAKVYKITRDEQGTRLTHFKITQGVLRVKALLSNVNDGEDEIWEEKVNQIRVYSGTKFVTVEKATSGMVVAVTGLSKTFPGQGFGVESTDVSEKIEPVLNYRIILPEGSDPLKVYNTIKVLGEEDPSLAITWNSVLKEMEIKLMGEIQIEILKEMISNRFNINLEFGTGNIVYKEMINNTVVGVGHYEPLRHYAEVHLRIEKGEPGSGIRVDSEVSTDKLALNWQRLIMTHIKEKRHKGVLTGSELVDVKITVIAGRAHKKHTMGGDFRQATYRAVRQGLMKAESVLLEPVYEFVLEVPSECTGRAMADIERMHGKCETPDIGENTTVIKGKAPVATMLKYQLEVMAYTKGRGRLSTTVAGYEPCHNADEIIEQKGYDPVSDVKNTPDSVFCANGSGYTVPYNRVEEFMHITDYDDNDITSTDSQIALQIDNTKTEEIDTSNDSATMEKELQQIFEKTYGPVKRKLYNTGEDKIVTSENKNKEFESTKKYYRRRVAGLQSPNEYMLVDGYNVIFAWDELNELAKENIDAARDKLMDILCNYQGVRKCHLMLVFDAYRVTGNPGSVYQYHNITVVYTKEAETADAFIEKFAHENARKYKVTVATSDGLEQIIIRGEGCGLISSRELKKEIEYTLSQAKELFRENSKDNAKKTYIFDNLDEEFKKHLEDVRLGKRELFTFFDEENN